MKIAVIGAGPAGMTAAYELSKNLGKKVTALHVFEKGDRVGGLSKSIELWDQRVDLGPHRFFSHDPDPFHRCKAHWPTVPEPERSICRVSRPTLKVPTRSVKGKSEPFGGPQRQADTRHWCRPPLQHTGAPPFSAWAQNYHNEKQDLTGKGISFI